VSNWHSMRPMAYRFGRRDTAAVARGPGWWEWCPTSGPCSLVGWPSVLPRHATGRRSPGMSHKLASRGMCRGKSQCPGGRRCRKRSPFSRTRENARARMRHNARLLLAAITVDDMDAAKLSAERMLTVSVYDDEIATLAADDGDLPIRRLTSSAARFEISPCVPARRRSPFDAATLCYRCDQLTAGRVPAQGRRNRAQSSRRWYLCGNIHRTGATGRFSNMDPDHLQCSRRTFGLWNVRSCR